MSKGFTCWVHSKPVHISLGDDDNLLITETRGLVQYKEAVPRAAMKPRHTMRNCVAVYREATSKTYRYIQLISSYDETEPTRPWYSKSLFSVNCAV